MRIGVSAIIIIVAFVLICSSFSGVFSGVASKQSYRDTSRAIIMQAKFIRNISGLICNCFGSKAIIPETNSFEIIPSSQNGQSIKKIITVEYSGCNRNNFGIGKTYKIIAKWSP